MHIGAATVDYARLRDAAGELRGQFASARPIRHVVVDGFFRDDVARKAASSFPDYADMEHVMASTVETRATESRLDRLDPIFEDIVTDLKSASFVSLLAELTGVADLMPPEAAGSAQIHQSIDGGFLNVHSDRNRERGSGRYYRINIIAYFNGAWRGVSGGALQLWDRNVRRCVTAVEPAFNRCIIFEVHDFAFHGYERLTLPRGEARKSLAISYVSPTPGPDQAPGERHTTFALRASDGAYARLQHYVRKAYHAAPEPLRVFIRDFKRGLPRASRR